MKQAQTNVTTDKLPKKPNRKAQLLKHPLADLAGKFEGEFWETTLEEIQRFREVEKHALGM